MRKKGKKNMFARVVDEIPDVFISATRNANLNKAINWWKKRETFCERGAVSISTRRDTGRKRVNTKALDRLRKIGLKFDSGLLRQLALRMLRRPDAPKADANGVLLEKKINTRWVQSFMETHNIILRAQSGKRQLSPEKTAEIEKSVAVHLGELKRGFESGKYDENVIENIDETHFVIDFDNGKTLGFGGESQVKNRLMSDLERKMYPTLYLHPRSHASKYHKFFATLACMDKENYNVQARLFITHRGGPSQ
ncbi:hypothetical protein PHYSODRAFT_514976 [Phytophthora sojae]|uniref:Uncharacterized protein n=1 Tax=Phytophthora sojae (strain P6497) TaxID=1094619 RepID=G4ZYI9_PHYSP|nr:hypothetical protein PHYSODRAFT_514976 [Phytophthora sojae]EGZ12748.1 hypothetical protein PHYSODRAFT_514976 [Phytophthora sojae]|eukprot:XP_009533081.1 hypothetical protein PHYSODRAFT_514976 [Phytophthora sojae]